MPPAVFQLGDAVAALAWSPDSRWLAVAGMSGPCVILGVPDGQPLQRLAGHAGGMFALDWVGSGPDLVTGGADGKVRWWSATRGTVLREGLGGAAWVEGVVASPDGRRVATRSGRHLRVWGGEDMPEFEVGSHESTVAAVAWRPDSRAVASACYGHVRAWRLGDPAPYEDLAWKGAFLSLAWSPGARFLCSGTQEGTIQFFRLPGRNHDPLQMTGYPSKIRNLAWDATGRWLASDGGPVVVVWDVSGRGPANTKPVELEGHPGKVSALQYQPAGPLLATGCEQGAVLVWEPSRAAEPVHAARWPSGIHALRWSPDGRWLAVGCRDGSIGLTAAAADWKRVGRRGALEGRPSVPGG